MPSWKRGSNMIRVLQAQFEPMRVQASNAIKPLLRNCVVVRGTASPFHRVSVPNKAHKLSLHKTYKCRNNLYSARTFMDDQILACDWDEGPWVNPPLQLKSQVVGFSASIEMGRVCPTGSALIRGE